MTPRLPDVHRSTNLLLLEEMGFRPARWLPTERGELPPRLRPPAEIVARALALRAVCLWVALDETSLPSGQITGSIQSHALDAAFTDADRKILALSRHDAQDAHMGTIGWRLENLWPLAWILGFEPPPALRGMIDDDTIPGLFAHLPKFDQAVAPFLATARVRPVGEVDAMEDLFYCAHNAVRSAQLGHDTVPEDFDPVADGGVLHERRHALTWALLPGVGWEETDLST